jgi:hypothetical protein
MLNATPVLKVFASLRARELQRQAASRDYACELQQRQLLKLVQHASRTRFGRDHGFSSMRSVQDFQAAVPVRKYEQFWEQYWKPSFPRLEDCSWPGLIRFFCVSSGTSSGTTKWIPYTPEMGRSNTKAGTDLLFHHVLNRPRSKLLGGRSFMLGGSTEFVEQSAGIYSGDLSGIAAKTLVWWAKARYYPPPEIALLKNWEDKIAEFVRSAPRADIRMISGVPSWMLIFFDKLFAAYPDAKGDLAKIFPKLEMIVHGGVNFSPYHQQFSDLLRNTQAELREVYPASEGFIALADRGYGEGLRLMLDNQLFYEFVPLEELDSKAPTRHWLKNVEPGVNYAIVLTTCAGLWSYVLGDTIEFTELTPPRLRITGRISYYLSAFGEHLTAAEVEQAVAAAALETGVDVRDFSVGALYPRNTSELGGHLYVIEFVTPVAQAAVLQGLCDKIDSGLCKLNEDYEAHRAKGFGLNPPKILAVPPGTFATWMKQRGKLGGQHKVPRIISKQELFADLVSFCEAQAGVLTSAQRGGTEA